MSHLANLIRLSTLAGVLTASACTLQPVGGTTPTEPVSPTTLSDQTKPVILSVDPWTYQNHPGRIVRTPYYRLFTTSDDPLLTQRLPAFLEDAMQHYTTGLGPLPHPKVRLDTFLMASRPQWVALTKQLMGKQAGTYLRIQRGGFAALGRGVFWNIGPRDTPAIAAHEGWHQYTQRTFAEPLPVWLEEGVATFMEGFRWDPARPEKAIFLPWANVERFDQLRRAASHETLMTLPELLNASPQNLINTTTDGTLTYYAQLWALLHFLHEGEDGLYSTQLHTLLLDAANNRLERTLKTHFSSRRAARAIRTRRGPDVFTAYFTKDLDLAARQYHAFINQVAASGSKNLIVAGRSPIPTNDSQAPNP